MPLSGADNSPQGGQMGHVQVAHFLGGALQAGVFVAQALHQGRQHLALVPHRILQKLVPVGAGGNGGGSGAGASLKTPRQVQAPTPATHGVGPKIAPPSSWSHWRKEPT